MRALGISLISLALTAAVIGNAYFQKKQFYPSVVYITKSNPSMAVIYIQSMVLVLMLGKLMRKIFLGTLRAAEFEHLMERFWYALTETCLAFTVFRDDFNPKFIALFTVLLFLKSFHWLAEDRVDYMERSPVIVWIFHLRVAGLVTVLGILDYMMISHAYHSTIAKGATVQLVFGFEYAILITMVANTTIKYILHATELRSENPWENKTVFLLYTELIIGFIRVILYILFVIIMVRIYTLPLFAFRPMYYTIRNFKKALNDVILSRRAIRNMNTLYPDVTPEELLMSDNICIICREVMVNSSKKLPCGHIFHTACLRSWFQRQQTCPTCRLNILRTAQPAPAVARIIVQARQNQPENDSATAANAQNVANSDNLPTGNNIFPTIPNISTSGTTGATNNTNSGNTNGMSMILPSFPLFSPYFVPPPPMPPSLDTLSDEELRALEGIERRHVEERIKLLKNIQIMLDASVALMNQYAAINSKYPIINNSFPTNTNVTQSTIISQTETIQQPQSSSSSTTTQVYLAPVDTTNFKENEVPLREVTGKESEKLVKLEDIGSEDHTFMPSLNKKEPVPGTSQGMTIEENSTSVWNIEDTSPAADLRRRRLQKFLRNDQNEKNE